MLLGGPISFLPQLQNHFRQTLSGEDVHLYVPEQAHLYTARGIALWVRDNPESAPPERTVSDLIAEVERLPGADAAQAWIDGARRYEATQHALDVIETPALIRVIPNAFALAASG